MSKPKTTTTILDWMTANPRPHTLEAITEGTNTTKTAAKRALASLTSDGHLTANNEEEETTWQTTTDNTATNPDNANPETSEGDTAMTEQHTTTVEATTDTDKQPVQPDPAILLVARTMTELDQPATVEAIAEKSFMAADVKRVVWALCALAAHEALTCSEPLKPEQATWETAQTPDEVMAIAAQTQLTDAPKETTCHACGHTTALPSPGKRRGRNGTAGVRNDGTPMLKPGELTRHATAWILDNPGESFTPNELNRELRSLHGDVISTHTGALRDALNSLTRPEKGELLEIAQEKPLTYRAKPDSVTKAKTETETKE